MTVKKRTFADKNYSAVWFKGKTIRIALDPAKDIKELNFPEFYDVKITNYCEGNCNWCYQNSVENCGHFENIIQKIKDYFEPMSENERPFQVAIGGGEPTSHPDFIKVLETFYNLNIVPNYTTNGMFINTPEADKIIKATKKYCGGVAVSCHPHLKEFWEKASKRFIEEDIMLNFHLIISNKKSIDAFSSIYNVWQNDIAYFVLLPHIAQGRAKHIDLNWDYLKTVVATDQEDIAFGANFYPYLVKDGTFKISLYQPELMSKYLDLSNMNLYLSSFNLSKVN